MLKSIEDVSPTQKRLFIEIPAEAIQKEIQSTLEAYKRQSRLPGFRPGKAPLSLIQKRYGRDAEAEVLRDIIPRSYSDALGESKIRPVSSPVFENSGEYETGKPLSMTVTVDVMQEVETPVYDGIKIRELPVIVTEEDIEKTLGHIRMQKASYEPLEGALSDGDVAVVDIREKESGREHNEQVLRVGDENLVKGLNDGLKGKKTGDESEITVTYPDDHSDKEIAGKNVELHLTIKDCRTEVLPELDDELAKDMGFDDLEAMKKHVTLETENRQKEAVQKIYRAQMLTGLIEKNPFEVPESLVQAEADNMIKEALEQGQTEDIEELKKTSRDKAFNNIKASYLLELIGTKEGISVSEDDIKSKIGELAGRINMTPENVMKYIYSKSGSLDGIKNAVFEEKTLAMLLEKAEYEKGDK